jgi:hypothetical protein
MIDNPEIKAWYIRENTRDTARDAQTLLLTIAYAAQMLFYYNLWSDAVDKRDVALDKQKVFLDYLYDKDIGVDFPMMQVKQSVLGLAVPAPDRCTDTVLGVYNVHRAGDSVDSKAYIESRKACGGMPEGWYLGEGALLAARANSYAGGILSNSGKRRIEHFQEEKTKLVLRAQATARMNAGPILAGYAQAASIQEGLAQIFAAGFNSAGVGLGSALGSMANSSGAAGASSGGA